VTDHKTELDRMLAETYEQGVLDGKARLMETAEKVTWCEVHRAAFEPLDPNPAATPGVCIIESEFGVDDPTNCRMVEKLLVDP
jgi:hypothetical protein